MRKELILAYNRMIRWGVIDYIISFYRVKRSRYLMLMDSDDYDSECGSDYDEYNGWVSIVDEYLV